MFCFVFLQFAKLENFVRFDNLELKKAIVFNKKRRTPF